jgi:hypothetical protein
MPAEKQQNEQQTTQQQAAETTREAAPDQLDFTRLDLTVEAVEERISPSETNVFDK